MSDEAVAAARVRAVLEETAATHRQAAAGDVDPIVRAAGLMRDAIARGGKILVCGNGGSATAAQHFAAELVGRYLKERRAWPALALSADTAIVTAIGNDYSFDLVFVRQVEAWGQPGDVLLGITTSGASKNVNGALVRARERGLTTVGLTGRDGGETGPLVDVHINVSSPSTPRVQEVQRTILHVICELIEQGLA